MIKEGQFDHLKGKPIGEVLKGVKKELEQHGDKVALANMERMGAIRDIHVGNLVLPIGGQIVIPAPVPDAHIRKRTILDDFGITPKG